MFGGVVSAFLGTSYIQYVVPGVLVMNVMLLAGTTAAGLAEVFLVHFVLLENVQTFEYEKLEITTFQRAHRSLEIVDRSRSHRRLFPMAPSVVLKKVLDGTDDGRTVNSSIARIVDCCLKFWV